MVESIADFGFRIADGKDADRGALSAEREKIVRDENMRGFGLLDVVSMEHLLKALRIRIL